jgi:signal peptidase II
MKKWITFAGVIGTVVLVADQISKVLVERAFTLGETLPVWSFFSLTNVRNQGAAWGMFQGAHYLLAGFAVIAMVACVFFWRKLFGESRVTIPVGGLLFAGIIGNFIDRVRLGYVVDFFDFHWGTYHFPCFNIADCAICVSVFLMILIQWWAPTHE